MLCVCVFEELANRKYNTSLGFAQRKYDDSSRRFMLFSALIHLLIALNSIHYEITKLSPIVPSSWG